MVEGSARVGDPAPHRPIDADLEQDVTFAATPDVLAWAVIADVPNGRWIASTVPRNRLRQRHAVHSLKGNERRLWCSPKQGGSIWQSLNLRRPPQRIPVYWPLYEK